MTVEKLERVLWRLRKRKPGVNRFTNHELRRAIMYECGTDPHTYKYNRKALRDLGWIRNHGKKWIHLTGADLTGDDA